ncbi:xanthine/uracil permease family protein [Thermosipho africanus H17ap60334]|jgi:AGZA family xanthine/uracil permease-like MFS transporter|uniref:NCS2 family permease n=1 Tax=Thermosipho TaxID=2420 RepID=UPI00028C3B26|nr:MULTISPECIES: NCS2 family permease [Thermosipho]EKF50193.1 xanthine/uracil permease family protein [Thermosipho africanus H17ap60334]MBZ4649969.1 xanthine/uracil permease family protein [Thermosipho sp. (in: thermotogales)]MDK2838789.1 adenine/guanine/hypoxanthine permease [Thermosipho sp. (in: thermotogales)]MDK2900634.1 adenine/guanine/hypoxanthine permease [Thermosipho sp. (in: thermotogales)]RDI90689.1 xanthine/uracil permease family protein [Thermosipho africanus Ob7]
MEKFFKLKESGSSVRTEIIAGITTFLTMAYIIFVNPNILINVIPGATPDSPLYAQFFGAFMVATILGAATATLIMGLWANYPFALAPGMGLNAYFAFTVCGKLGIDWRVALAAVFVEGILFILLAVSGVRGFVVKAIPNSIKLATSAGIGLFIAFIGLKSAGIVVADGVTYVTLGDLTSPTALVTIIGFFIIAILFALRVPGSILIGILASTFIGMIPAFNVTNFQGVVGKIPDISPTFFKLFEKFSWADLASGTFWIVVFTFFFVDFFDTLGTLTGLAESAGFIKNGEFPRANRAYLSDAVGTTVGALFGTSTVTTYIESSTGIAEGGRTGLTAVVVAILMLLMLFFAPLGMSIPAAATAPALIFVGALMLKGLKGVNWDDITEALPAFITMIIMPLTYSIANGIALGLIVYPIVKTFSGKTKDVHWLNWILAFLFVLYLIYLRG